MLCVNPFIKLEGQRERFRLIEGDIFSYPMSFKEKELLLIASAVGRHSGEYWFKQVNDPSSKWKPYFPTPNDPGGPLAEKKWPTEDAKGAVSGAIGGAIGGATTGPGGALVGGVLGAVGGSIGASVASALFD